MERLLHNLTDPEREEAMRMYGAWVDGTGVWAEQEARTNELRTSHNNELLAAAPAVAERTGFGEQFAAYRKLVIGSEYYAPEERFLNACRQPLADFYGESEQGGLLAKAGVEMVAVVTDGLDIHRWFERDDPDFKQVPYGGGHVVRSHRSVLFPGQFALRIEGPRYGGLIARGSYHSLTRLGDDTINPQWLRTGRWTISDAVLGSAISTGRADLILADKDNLEELVTGTPDDLGRPPKPSFKLPVKTDMSGSCGSCTIRTCRHRGSSEVKLSDRVVTEIAAAHRLAASVESSRVA